MRFRSSKPAALLIGAVATAVVISTGDPAGAVTASGRSIASPATAALAAAAGGDDVGRWAVAATADGHYQLSWTSPTVFPVTDARPEITADGDPVGLPTLAADGRTVTVTVDTAVAPNPDDFDVVLSGEVLDETGDAAPSVAVPSGRPVGLAPIAEDPGDLGTHIVQSGDYTLPPVKLPNIPQLSEMLGHVVEPVDATNDSPLVLFLHGRHSACYLPGATPEPQIPIDKASTDNKAAPKAWKCRGKTEPIPSYLGYDYIQRLLASQGYVTVSISANAINDLDWHAADGGALARAALIKAHLEAWETFVSEAEHPADLTNVILVGHSRGGEGVNRASVNLPVDAGYNVTGQVLIGPTDFGFQTSPYVPTVTILPYCDGDVSDLQGQIFTDAARDLVDEPVFHSSLMVMGANHNFFNKEWTPGVSVAPSNDDWYGNRDATCGKDNPARLNAVGQRKVGKSYIAGAVHLFADGDEQARPLFDGSAVTVPSADNVDVRSHAIGGGQQTVRPGIDSSIADDPTASVRLCRGQASTSKPITCDPNVDSTKTPHWPGSYNRGIPLRRAFEMSWTEAGQVGGLTFDSIDLSDDATLDLRTIVDPPQGRVRLGVQLHDGSGDTSDVYAPGGGVVLFPLPGGGYSLAKRWAQTLRIPLADITGVDLGDITGVDLVSQSLLDGTADGRVWVLDLSATPDSGFPTLPSRDVSTISVGSVTLDEGDGTDPAVAEVPYTVGGAELTEDATVNVVTVDNFDGTSSAPQTLVIPAGTTSGTVDLPYQPNTIDDPARRLLSVAVYAVQGIETNRYIGGVTILDDDPSPTITIKPVARRIGEGDVAQWKITLSEPTSYYLGVVAKPVRAGIAGKQLTVGDLTKRFRERYFYPVPDLDTPITQTDLQLYTSVRPGHVSAIVSFPTVKDNKHEGPRKITFRFRVDGVPGSQGTYTVTVTDQAP